MDVYKSKNELRRMRTGDLFRLALNQEMSKCLIGARPCGFLLHYKGSNFCVSEIFREGCQVERSKQLEQRYDEKGETSFSLPFLQEMGTELQTPGERGIEFRVYCKNHLLRSTIFLGKTIERRRKERGDNLKGLLFKAIKEYSGQRVDPSTIFLMEG
jgi:hypothetical protein